MKQFLALIVLVMVLFCNSLFAADSLLQWSNPASQNGTYIAGGILVTNSTLSNCTHAGTSSIGTSYGYPVALTGSNGETAVSLIQIGTNDTRGTTQTNTFPVTFIAVPAVMYQANNGVMTNILTVTSNQFLCAGTANVGSWIAIGRIK